MAIARPPLRAPAPVAYWLAKKTAGERRVVAAILVVALLASSWAAIWQPLVRDTATVRAELDGGGAALANARRMTEEIAGLERTAAAPAPPADARAALERVLGQQNLRSSVTQLDWQDGRARVVFAAVGYDALMSALETLQRDARLRAVEVVLTARVEPGTVRAELTLAR